MLQGPATAVNTFDWPFLIKDYQLSYAWSSQLLIPKNLQKTKKVDPIKFGGFAPKYFPEEAQIDTSKERGDELDIEKEDLLDTFIKRGSSFKRGSYRDLPDARLEVMAVSEMLEGDSWLEEEATEANFKKMADQYGIIHLSMHGILDDENPLYSKLIFTQKDSVSGEDNQVTAAELYNMQLNAGMAVLSACNTGVGELKRGEGVLSLSRAFAYAGCPSTIMSLWSVPDEPTSAIVVDFYDRIKKGATKDQALREAKLRFLEKNPPNRQYPYYWAGFIASGDMSAIVAPSLNVDESNSYWVIGLVLSLLVLGLFFWRIIGRR